MIGCNFDLASDNDDTKRPHGDKSHVYLSYQNMYRLLLHPHTIPLFTECCTATRHRRHDALFCSSQDGTTTPVVLVVLDPSPRGFDGGSIGCGR